MLRTLQIFENTLTFNLVLVVEQPIKYCILLLRQLLLFWSIGSPCWPFLCSAYGSSELHHRSTALQTTAQNPGILNRVLFPFGFKEISSHLITTFS